MEMLCSDPKFRFIGYGLLNGKGANGTAKMVPNEQTVEVTVCEQLMMGMAQGMAMCGYKPLVLVERMDFVLCCLDALVNHLDKCAEISRGEFNPCCIIRIVVGNRNKPLFTGPTHVQDFTEALHLMLKMPVIKLLTAEDVMTGYREAKANQDAGVCSTCLVEMKDLL